MPEPFWEYAARWAIYILNRTPNRFDGEWQREAIFQMFSITADYSRFRIPFSKAYVLKRPHEWRKDWSEKGYKGILVGIRLGLVLGLGFSLGLGFGLRVRVWVEG